MKKQMRKTRSLERNPKIGKHADMFGGETAIIVDSFDDPYVDTTPRLNPREWSTRVR